MLRRVYKKREPCYTVGDNVNWYSHYREQYGDSLTNWKKKAIKRPWNPTPGLISGEKHDPKDACIPMFTAAVFAIAKTGGEGEVAQSCPTLWDPVDCNLWGFSVHGILQARILEWIAISFPRGSSQPKDRTQVSCIAGRHFNLWATREAHCRWPINICWRISGNFKVHDPHTFNNWKSTESPFSHYTDHLMEVLVPESWEDDLSHLCSFPLKDSLSMHTLVTSVSSL